MLLCQRAPAVVVAQPVFFADGQAFSLRGGSCDGDEAGRGVQGVHHSSPQKKPSGKPRAFFVSGERHQLLFWRAYSYLLWKPSSSGNSEKPDQVLYSLRPLRPQVPW